jgi:hypothetical protein
LGIVKIKGLIIEALQKKNTKKEDEANGISKTYRNKYN